jgi:hypothetical protein
MTYTKATDCKCCVCGKQAVAFWPVIDPDIPSKYFKHQSLMIKYPIGEITITVNYPIDLNDNNNNED